jgi:uncharacterized protein (TIRG00374 family)
VTKKLRLAAGIAILLWLAWRTPWSEVIDAFARLRWVYWFAAVGVYIVAQAISTLRWRLLAEPLGFRRPFIQFVGFYFIGMFFNLVLPTSVGGDFVRAWYLDNRSGKRLAAFLSVFVDRFTGLLVLLAVTCLACLASHSTLPEWMKTGVWTLAGGALVGTTVAMLLAAWLRRHAAASARRTGKSARPDGQECASYRPRFSGLLRGIVRKGHRFLLSLADVITLYRQNPRLLLSTTLLSLLVQAGNIFLVWLIAVGLSANVSLAHCAVLVPLVAIATLLPVSVGGHGVREAAMVLLLKPFGVPAGTALTLAFLWFLASFATSLLGVWFYLFGNYPRLEVDSDHGPVSGDSDQGRTGQPAAAA